MLEAPKVRADVLARLDALEARQTKGRKQTTDRLTATCFDQQRAFLEDESTFATADCSRRAGKSNGIAKWLLEGPIKDPAAPSLYSTISRKEAKRIIWGVMKDLNRSLGLGYEPNESELILYRHGVASVYLMGVNTKDEIEKARGTGWGRVALDEAQTLPQYVQDMINDVLLPSFIDHDGKLRVIGTPSPVPSGFFYDTTVNPEYKHHKWTVWDNPYLKDKAPAMLEKVLRVRGLTVDDPGIQREWFGRWVLDSNALVFKYSPERNVYASLPAGLEWRHVLAVDLGHDDADAIVVLAFSDASPNVYLIEEHVEAKQTISALADRLDVLMSKYDPVALVMDTGGLGKKIAAELQQRRGLPVEAAEKKDKLAHIELVNDAFRTGRLFLPPGSRCGEDAMKVEWDRTTPEKPKISDRFHSDALDALLYGFRACLHWLHVPPAAPVAPPDSPERFAQAERELMEHLEHEAAAAIVERQEDEAWGWQ